MPLFSGIFFGVPMLRGKRVIPVLLGGNRKLVKGEKFSQWQYVGDPLNIARIFSHKEVDELVYIDIVAAQNQVNPDYVMLRKISEQCFMPLTYGGGIRSLEDAKKAFDEGIEKILVQGALRKNPSLVTQIAERFGSSSVAVGLDFYPDPVTGFPHFPTVAPYWNKTKGTEQLFADVVSLGAGEIFLTDMTREGTRSGPSKVMDGLPHRFQIPFVYSGGVRDRADAENVLDQGFDAVGVGASFVFFGPQRGVITSYFTG